MNPTESHDLPDEAFEPEVLREMKIHKMELPDHWPEYITPDQLEQFSEELRTVLVGMNRIETKVDFSLRWQQLTNRHQRQLEAEIIRARIAKEKEKPEDLKVKWIVHLIRWGGITIGAGAVAAAIKKLFDKIFP